MANPVNGGPQGANVGAILAINPEVPNDVLAGAVAANFRNFHGNISVATKIHHFAVGDRLSRFIYISPYGSFRDFLVDFKRVLVGVAFPQVPNNGTHITDYVLGLLNVGTPDYTQAEQEFQQAHAQGRRLTVIIATDASAAELLIDQDKSACAIL